VTSLPALAIGLALGAMAISLHMALLGRAINSVAAHDTARRGYIVKTAPIRILLWLPVLFIIVRIGLAACLGMLASLLVGRAIWVGRFWSDVS